MILKGEDLMKIDGGAGKSFIYGGLAFIGLLIGFIAGICDGYANPLVCRG